MGVRSGLVGLLDYDHIGEAEDVFGLLGIGTHIDSDGRPRKRRRGLDSDLASPTVQFTGSEARLKGDSSLRVSDQEEQEEKQERVHRRE
jgi:hypothetical protein